MTNAFVDDPIVSGSSVFSLAPPDCVPPSTDVPSQVGVRPWGLRRAGQVLAVRGKWDGVRFDHELQLAVTADGTALIEVTSGPPTAPTTPPVDGEDPPSSEDWVNDYTPDHPWQP